MKAECPMGHTENLSFGELAERLMKDDFDCKEEGCAKSLTYEIDEVFWNDYVVDALIEKSPAKQNPDDWVELKSIGAYLQDHQET